MRAATILAAGAALVLTGQPALAAPQSIEMAVRGPDGPLAGTLLMAEAPGAPVVLILPGSGPTDRDGNSAGGLAAGSYRLLAEHWPHAEFRARASTSAASLLPPTPPSIPTR